MKALVTGGAGFIGSHLADSLVEAGHEVTVFDLLDPHRESVQFRRHDMRMYCVYPDLEEFDVIYHFAANAYVPPSVHDPLGDHESNCDATLNLLDTLRRHRWRGRFVYASSAAVYGSPRQALVNESYPTVPVSPYGCGKLAAERYCNVYAALYGMKVASLRLFSVYGPGQHKQVIWDLMNKIQVANEAIEVHGDGTQIRDFVYVDDVVKAAQLVAERAEMAGEVYNVGSGDGVSIETLALSLCDLMGSHPQLDYTGVVRLGDPQRFIADITRIQQLGYEPRVLIEEGLKNTVEWFHGLG